MNQLTRSDIITDADSAPEPPLERHPWEPWTPDGAKVLIMGTFPPGDHRWSMDFYYPNRTNDFWRIFGLIFLGDRDALLKPGSKDFDLTAIKQLLTERHIALNDTARAVRRLRGNASDKYLEIVEPVPLADLLGNMPDCSTVATTGEKAAGVVAAITGTGVPAMGAHLSCRFPCSATSSLLTQNRRIEIWRMPSTSRAYPMALEKKAEYYRTLMVGAGIL